jgi:hypothetical protein
MRRARALQLPQRVFILLMRISPTLTPTLGSHLARSGRKLILQARPIPPLMRGLTPLGRCRAGDLPFQPANLREVYLARMLRAKQPKR